MLTRSTPPTHRAALLLVLLLVTAGCSDAAPVDATQTEALEGATSDGTDDGDEQEQATTDEAAAVPGGATAHYPLETDLESVGGRAPALQPVGDVQLVDDDDLTGSASVEFSADGGLALDVSELITSDTYTLAFRFYLDSGDSGWLKLVDLDDRQSDRGFYAYTGGLQFHGHTQVEGEAPIGGQPYATVAVRRDADGQLSWFLNGEQQAEIDDSELQQGVLGSDTLHFFVDDTETDDSGEEQSSGRLAWLTVYDQPLGDSSIFELSAT